MSRREGSGAERGRSAADPAIEGAKRASWAQLLFRCARILDERALARMRTLPGLERMRPAHTKLFPHVDLEGTRLTDLATRVGVSKQAVGQLVDELVEMGTFERIPDPVDGRAKLIRFRSIRGVNVIMEGFALLRGLELEVESALGERATKQLHRHLLALEAWLAADALTEPPPLRDPREG